jgi:peptide/nickel transport system permease protein
MLILIHVLKRSIRNEVEELVNNKKNTLKPETVKQTVKRSVFAEIWRNYKKSYGAMIGLVLIIAMVITGLLGSMLLNYEEQVIKQDIPNGLQQPSSLHWFGTDQLGRDIFYRVIYASRFSMSIGFVSVIISGVVGIALGAIAGYYGGITDTIIMRITDVFMSIPSILFGIIIVAALGQNIGVLMIAVSIGGIPAIVRVSRASVMTVRDQEFIEAARAIGSRDRTIIFHHVLPNSLAPILVQITLRIGTSIIGISTLSFLGLGVAEPAPEWGGMLSSGRAYIRDYSYMTMFPGIAILFTVLGFNLIGDGLRDSLDPTLKK